MNAEEAKHLSADKVAYHGLRSGLIALWKRCSHATIPKSFLLLAVAGFSSTGLFAQSAVFTGHVADSTGAIISKAQITVHDEETGANRTTTTTASGDYSVPYLKPGVYSVSAEANGFRQENKVHVTLQVGSSRVDLQACKLEYSIVSPK